MMNNTESVVLEELAEILAELDAMTPMTSAGTIRKTDEEHQAWMAKSKHIQDLIRKAEVIARRTLPTEIAMALWRVNQRAYRLYDRPTEGSEDAPNA